MKILGEKYTKNELVFCIYALASQRCIEALGLKHIDDIIGEGTTDEQKRDYCALLATYLNSMREAVVKARETNVVDQLTSMYGLMARTGKKIVDIAAQEKELFEAAKKSKVVYHASESTE